MIYAIHMYVLYIFKEYLWENMKKTENEACLSDGGGSGWEQRELEKLLTFHCTSSVTFWNLFHAHISFIWKQILEKFKKLVSRPGLGGPLICNLSLAFRSSSLPFLLLCELFEAFAFSFLCHGLAQRLPQSDRSVNILTWVDLCHLMFHFSCFIIFFFCFHLPQPQTSLPASCPPPPSPDLSFLFIHSLPATSQGKNVREPNGALSLGVWQGGVNSDPD